MYVYCAKITGATYEHCAPGRHFFARKLGPPADFLEPTTRTNSFTREAID